MTADQLVKGVRVWSWWRHELLLFTGNIRKNNPDNFLFQFENFGDCLVWVPEDLICELEYRADR